MQKDNEQFSQLVDNSLDVSDELSVIYAIKQTVSDVLSPGGKELVCQTG